MVAKIWNRFHSQSIYDDKYIKTKVKTFGGATSTFFFSKDEIPKEGNHYMQKFLLIPY